MPWESCVTLGQAFSFKYEDVYKTPREVIQLLINIVAKGGNLALNITPQPDGRLPLRAVEVLQELGEFLKINGDGIYGTRVCEPYNRGKFAFTKKGDRVYVFYLYQENEEVKSEFTIPASFNVASIKLMGDDTPLEYEVKDNNIIVCTKSRNCEKILYVDGFCIELR